MAELEGTRRVEESQHTDYTRGKWYYDGAEGTDNGREEGRVHALVDGKIQAKPGRRLQRWFGKVPPEGVHRWCPWCPWAPSKLSVAHAQVIILLFVVRSGKVSWLL